MFLYRRKTYNESWILAPESCLRQQDPGYEYRYFENEDAAKLNNGFFSKPR